jgi:EpsI family protein
LVAWLLFRRWQSLSRPESRPGHPAVSTLLLALALGSYAWAIRSQAADLLALSLCLGMLGAAHLLAGTRGLRVVLLPAAFLLFAIPLPAPLLNQLVWTLQIRTAEYAGALLHVLGVSALVSGDQILLSDGVFEVIETCSGLRSIETLTMLAVLMADLFRRHGVHAVLLVAAAPPVAFAINGFRAVALVINPHSDVAAVHNLQGVAMLLAGVVILYLLDGALARLLRARGDATAGADLAPGSSADRLPRLVALTLLAAVGAALSFCLPQWRIEPFEPRRPAEVIARNLDGWEAQNLETDWMFLGRTAFGGAIHRRYTRGAEQVELFVGSWHLGRRFRSAFSPKTAFPGSGWIVEEVGTLPLGDREVATQVIRNGARRLLVAHWYEGAAGLAGETLRALLALDASPLRRRHVPAVVRLATPFGGDPAAQRAAETRLAQLAARIADEVQELVTPRGPRS